MKYKVNVKLSKCFFHLFITMIIMIMIQVSLPKTGRWRKKEKMVRREFNYCTIDVHCPVVKFRIIFFSLAGKINEQNHMTTMSSVFAIFKLKANL